MKKITVITRPLVQFDTRPFIRPFIRKSMGVLLMILTSFAAGTYAQAAEQQVDDSAQVRQLMQLAEYIGVDYSEAVVNGQIKDPEEYLEMVEFAQLIVDKSQTVSELRRHRNISEQARTLQTAIANKHDLDIVQILTADLRKSLLELAPQASLPGTLLPKAQTLALFTQSCMGCHGASGQGDGLLASQLSPAPTDFTDKERALNRSVLGLYDAIANGIDGTAMPGFGQLTDQQKWSLAFFTGSLAFAADNDTDFVSGAVSLQQLVNYSPKTLAQALPNDLQVQVEQLRAQPQLLFVEQDNPLTFTRQQLHLAHQAYRQGDTVKATNLAVSAYLDGFELVENNLDAIDTPLRKNLEVNLMRLRQVLGVKDDVAGVDNMMAITITQLQQAEQLLQETKLSGGALFSASLVILLREGLEALLVVLALVTVLQRTHRQDALRYVHLGWLSALAAGGITWLVAEYLITISGASREVMEGVAALLAAVVLFYVGFWMHNKTSAKQWQTYIEQSIQTNLKTGTLWGITLLAFIAVYREVFETVLFYQSLLTQAAASQHSTVIAGFVTGTFLLSLVAWALVKYSVKLPLARFFAVTTYLLLALSFVLMGKAVLALQEASLISSSPLPVTIEFGWMGVSSSWQAMSAQAVILLLSVALVLRTRLLKVKRISPQSHREKAL